MDCKNQAQLYSADKSNDLETIELVLRENFDTYFNNQEGLTPLQILVQKRIIMFDDLHAKQKDECTSNSNYCWSVVDPTLRVQVKKQDLKENEKLIVMLLNDASANLNLKDDMQLNFYAACTLMNSAIAESLSKQITNVNESVENNSTIWPGYTALHFAAHCNVNTVKMLITKGANLLMQNAHGVTPLQILLKSFSLEIVQSVLTVSSVCRNILFSDGRTKLVDYIFSLRNPDLHKEFLQKMGRSIDISLPDESPLWPGLSVLHLVLTLLRTPNLQIIQDILTANSNVVTMQNIQGSTPVHMAFRQGNLKVVELLLKYQKNSINSLDRDNLSHLHIAAAINNQRLVGKLLWDENNLNIAYKGEPLPSVKLGWTPLHTASSTNHAIVARMLLQRGANLLQTDSRGFTAIHLLLGSFSTKRVAQFLFDSNQFKECIVKDVGLTHLHAAVWKNEPEAIERLLDMGSEIEATIGKFEEKDLQKFDGCRPIHIAMMDYNKENAFEVLLRRGADIFARRFDEPCPFIKILTDKYNDNYVKSIVNFFWGSIESQKKIQQEMGITMLHLVCYARDIEKVQQLLKNGIDINVKTRVDFSVWPGFTPLHVLIWTALKLQHYKHLQNNINDFCGYLLRKGADVTLSNPELETPVLMALNACSLFDGNKRAALLMQNQQDFSINPTNKAGMSHFHVACLLSEVETANKFLKHVNPDIVNQQISVVENYRFSGQTPLLMALTCRTKMYYNPELQVQMVNLLLKLGANIHVVDALGYTPLHRVCACTLTREILMDKILIDNKDINKRTNDGKTPIEILLRDGAPVDKIAYFVTSGSQINTYNKNSDDGYMGYVLNSSKYKKFKAASKILKIMMSSPDVCKVDDTGRNAIHNAVAFNNGLRDSFRGYEDLIQNLIDSGCNIFQQDTKGRTPLHLAVKYKNTEAVKALLKCGSDVNIVDSAMKAPFFYAAENGNEKRFYIDPDSNEDNSTTCEILAKHVRLLQHVGLQVIRSNAIILSELSKNRQDVEIEFDEDRINRLLAGSKKVKICSRKFTLRDFLREMSAVDVYSCLNKSDRHAVNSFFKPIRGNHYFELTGLLKLQYRKALERPSLITPAVNGLRILMGFPLPDLCVHIVLMQLSNLDLKNMTAAASMDIN